MGLNVATRSPARNRISRATLTEQLEEAMHADILDGVLAPGQRLRAIDLTERYGVSVTPLREALQRLAVKNLVELDPRYGATVAPISVFDLRDIYEQLQLIGCLALERSIARGEHGWADEVSATFTRLTEAMDRQEQAAATADDDTRRRLAGDASAAHWDFHNALYGACDSPWLMRFVEMLHAHSERYRRLAQHAGGQRRDTLHEHEDIMAGAANRDAAGAVAALRDHLGLTVRLLEDTFGEGAQARV